mmetsp:Transcript_34185/g.80487  ORF Transcript_34185/g.80487 Transcript_34185/m.80487 type:complete len:261 (+) Transcript_34185:762-1544(+)
MPLYHQTELTTTTTTTTTLRIRSNKTTNGHYPSAGIVSTNTKANMSFTSVNWPFFDATLNMEQSPWGRSSSSEFQQRLASEFHCIAKIQLPNWLHVRDSISVWKRSEICQMVFVGDEDDESEEMIEYRHIPPEEMLPTSITAPCMERLLLPSMSAREGSSTVETKAIGSMDRSKHNTETKEKATDLDKVLTDQKVTEEDESEGQLNSKKTKRGRRRERQKQKKIIIHEEQRRRGKKCEGSEEHPQKRFRFWLHGSLPPPT